MIAVALLRKSGCRLTVAPALAAGCAQVLKPAPETPFSALALAKLAESSGLPPGLFSVVTGDAREIGAEMMANPSVRLLSFTGSTPVGKHLMRGSADTVKKLELELGGHAPFIVFSDADIGLAVRELIACKFRNMGQVCIAANKVFVHEDVYTEFSRQLRLSVAKLRVGPGIDPLSDQGPLINRPALDKVRRHVDDAVSKGARVVIGGSNHALGGNYFEPTILGECRLDMLVAREETFGPVAPLFRFGNERELLDTVNATEVGLASYIFTTDLSRAWRTVEALEYGMVGLNSGMLSSAEAPFGGVKQSGIGREGSRAGIEAFVETKYVCLGLHNPAAGLVE